MEYPLIETALIASFDSTLTDELIIDLQDTPHKSNRKLSFKRQSIPDEFDEIETMTLAPGQCLAGTNFPIRSPQKVVLRMISSVYKPIRG